MSGVDWTFEEERCLLRITYRGLVGRDDLRQGAAVRRQLGIEAEGVRLLVDSRKADWSEITAADFKSLEELRKKGDAVIDQAACVIESDLDWGIAKLWAMFRNNTAPDSSAVFVSELDALAWLYGDEQTIGS
ncbi:MAG: hypothetical protein NXI07_14230 [bacterium]|nr:hypothetical protein [bacterium]